MRPHSWFLTVVGVLVLHADLAAADLVLADQGRALLPIVLPDAATGAERYAARELAAHLQQISDAPFTMAPTAQGPAIRLAYAADLGGEEYAITADAGSVTIRGGRPRGVLYGTYALLEDVLGCRWYTRDCHRIPRTARLAVPADLKLRVKPRLEYREPFWTEAFDGDWAARNRMNAANARLTAQHGGKITYGAFVHTFARILDPQQHFATHPEWFSQVKGRRIAAHTQLCLTHPDVLAAAIRTVREWIAKNPQATIFSVSQNDWRNPCTCPACAAIDEAEGSHAGSLIAFVNQVADAIGKDHPQIAIDTLAYQYTRKPPRTMKPRPNVIVRLCSIECCFSHPLDGCPEKTNTSFMEDLKGWNRLTDRLYVWDYVTNFHHYVAPFPNLAVLDRNIRTFADHGVVGIFEQGNYSRGGGGELSELRAWVLAKLLWDPAHDGQALIREFVAGAYGPAAAQVQAFIDAQQAAIAASGEHARIFDGLRRDFLDRAVLLRCDALLEEAEKASSGDPLLRARVLRLRVPIWYTRINRGGEPPDTLRPLVERLVAVAKELRYTHFCEHTGIERDLAKLEALLARKPVSHAPGIIPGEDSAFTLYQEGDLSAIVADAKAEDGFAARQPGRTREWSVAWNLEAVKERPGATHLLRARIRIDRKGETGPAFHVGAYDHDLRKGLGEIRIAAATAPDGEYVWYDICRLVPKPGISAYVAPDDNETNVTAIYTDRFELVPVE